MTLLWDRGIRVKVGPYGFTKFRISAEVNLSLNSIQDSGRIQIYNLNSGTSSNIEKENQRITLEAGYGGKLDLLFDGAIQRASSERAKDARITSLTISDNISAVREDKTSLGGYFSDSYKGSVQLRMITGDIIRRGLGMTPSNLDLLGNQTTTNFTFDGKAVEALKRILSKADPTCSSYSDGTIVRITQEGGTGRRDAPVVKVNEDTGLIGRPIKTDEGWQLKSLLLPRARPDGLAEIDSETVKGRFKIVTVGYRLDNWSGPFETSLSLRNLA